MSLQDILSSFIKWQLHYDFHKVQRNLENNIYWEVMLESEPLLILKIMKYIFFFKDFIYWFSERREGRERNINVWLLLKHPILGTWPATQACALTGNPSGDPSVCRTILNPLSHLSQGWNKYSYYILHVNKWSLGHVAYLPTGKLIYMMYISLLVKWC